MLRIFQNAKKLISVCLATLIIVVSTITIFPSTASAAVVEINVIKCESGSNCSSTPSFVAGAIAGSAVTLIATGQAETIASSVIVANAVPIISSVAAMGQAAVTTLAPLADAAGTIGASPLLVPVGVAAAGAYSAYQLWNSFNDNQSQNAN
jgi:hypothetical protein